VHCTRARNVKKPRGVKVGTVQVSRGRVLKVRPEIGDASRSPARFATDRERAEKT
jgi:hypothetical protein